MLNSVGNRYLDVPRLIWQHQNTKPDGPHEPSPSKEALRRSYCVDEEETFMQALDDALRRDGKTFESLDEGLIQVLEEWTNDRACYPMEWVKQIINKVIMHERRV